MANTIPDQAASAAQEPICLACAGDGTDPSPGHLPALPWHQDRPGSGGK